MLAGLEDSEFGRAHAEELLRRGRRAERARQSAEAAVIPQWPLMSAGRRWRRRVAGIWQHW